MLLSHDLASGDVRLVRSYQVEGELEPAFPGCAGIDADQDILQSHFCLTTVFKARTSGQYSTQIGLEDLAVIVLGQQLFLGSASTNR